MTPIDHQQAAIDQVAEILHDYFGCSPGGEASPGCECDPEPYESDAEHILTAAAPHLRAAWAEQIRDEANMPPGKFSDDWRSGFVLGVLKSARILESGGE